MSLLGKLWLSGRAALFWTGFAASTVVTGLLLPLVWLLPFKWRYPAVRLWNRFNLWWLQVTCGVRYRVIGQENIPTQGAFIIMANHQSTWETLALPCIFPQQISWVLKRELLNIPVFGWGLRLIRPIAIDRSAGKLAVRQVAEQGKALLQEGICVVIFPEGTRVVPEQTVPFKVGGAVLAAQSGFPVLPVAHNAGKLWRRHSWIKWPGTVTVSIGVPFETEGKRAEEINATAESWIVAEKNRL